MRPIFEYRRWKTDKPDFDQGEYYQYRDEDPAHRVICPEPSCLQEAQTPGAAGTVLLTGALGEPTTLAAPCQRHQDFQYLPGWYQRFSEALDRRNAPESGAAPRICACGKEFRVFLWGWGADNCPECAYRRILRFGAGRRVLRPATA